MLAAEARQVLAGYAHHPSFERARFILST